MGVPNHSSLREDSDLTTMCVFARHLRDENTWCSTRCQQMTDAIGATKWGEIVREIGWTVHGAYELVDLEEVRGMMRYKTLLHKSIFSRSLILC